MGWLTAFVSDTTMAPAKDGEVLGSRQLDMAALLEGKIALVTGGSSGIGKRTAVKFAEEGARVVVADLREAEGNETVRLIREAGSDGFFVRADVSQEPDVQAMVAAAVETYGKLDCAFNNAGKLTRHDQRWIDTPIEFFDELMDPNLRGVWLCMKHELRTMVDRGSGVIVNNSSIGGIRGGGGEIYAASKHGVVGLTRNAALTFGPAGIRVNAVAPGIIATETYLDNLAKDPESAIRTNVNIPLGRVGTTEEVAEAVVWLSSAASSYVTGSILMLDGGLSETDSAHWDAQRRRSRGA